MVTKAKNNVIFQERVHYLLKERVDDKPIRKQKCLLALSAFGALKLLTRTVLGVMELIMDCNEFRRQVRKWGENAWKLLKVVLLKAENNWVEVEELLWVETIIPEEKKNMTYSKTDHLLIFWNWNREKWQRTVTKELSKVQIMKGILGLIRNMKFIQYNHWEVTTCFKQGNDMIRIWFRNKILAALRK